MTNKRPRVPIGLPIAAVITLILGIAVGPVIRSLASEEQLATNVLLSAIPFVLIFVSIILFFISLLATSTVARLGHGLQALRLSARLCMLLLFSYRYIFVIHQEFKRLHRAAKLLSGVYFDGQRVGMVTCTVAL